MNLIPLLSDAWPASARVLFHVQGAPVTAGGLLVLCGFFVLSLLLCAPAGRLARALLRRRGVRDPGLQTLGAELVQLAVVLAGVGAGLQLGALVTADDFLNALWWVFNATIVAIGDTPISLATIATVALVIGGALWGSRLLRAGIHRAMVARGLETGRLAVLERLSHYLIVVVSLGVALDTVGIELGALFAAGAVFAVGIGFAMQNIAQNFVSGVIVLVERAIKPGDVLEVEGRVVRVEQMGIRSTVVRTLDDEDLIVPNSILAQNSVKNFTLLDRIYRVRVVVGVSYESDLRLVERTLLAAAGAVDPKTDDKDPVVLLIEFGPSSVDFEVSIWIHDPWSMRRAASELRKSIWWAFQDAGITLAFPQVDVHLDADVREGLRAIGGAKAP